MARKVLILAVMLVGQSRELGCNLRACLTAADIVCLAESQRLAHRFYGENSILLLPSWKPKWFEQR